MLPFVLSLSKGRLKCCERKPIMAWREILMLDHTLISC